MIKNNFPLIQKWFSNENEAFISFSQKKLSLHTPILVRYNNSGFKIKIENEKLTFVDNITNFLSNEKEITIEKLFLISSFDKKSILFTNLGVFLVKENHKKNLIITDIFLETTIGRLIFSINFKKSLKT
jgi:hypothetical protein